MALVSGAAAVVLLRIMEQNLFSIAMSLPVPAWPLALATTGLLFLSLVAMPCLLVAPGAYGMVLSRRALRAAVGLSHPEVMTVVQPFLDDPRSDPARIALTLLDDLGVTTNRASAIPVGSRMALGLALTLTAYLTSALVVFDFTQSAIPIDQEFDEAGRRVSFGPEPRWPFTYGGNLDIPGGWDFHGNEPVFQVYRPICLLWLRQRGYGIPNVWR